MAPSLGSAGSSREAWKRARRLGDPCMCVGHAPSIRSHGCRCRKTAFRATMHSRNNAGFPHGGRCDSKHGSLPFYRTFQVTLVARRTRPCARGTVHADHSPSSNEEGSTSQPPILLSFSNLRIVPEASVRWLVETVEDPVPPGSWERAFQRSKTRCSNTRQERRFALNSFASGLHRRAVQEREGRDVRIYDATTQRYARGTLPSRPWRTWNRERAERVSKERVQDRNRS